MRRNTPTFCQTNVSSSLCEICCCTTTSQQLRSNDAYNCDSVPNGSSRSMASTPMFVRLDSTDASYAGLQDHQ
jgi:hypothetical protein